MNNAKGKWVIKGEVPREVLYGLLLEPEGGVEVTTPHPTSLTRAELAKLINQDKPSRNKRRDKRKTKR